MIEKEVPKACLTLIQYVLSKSDKGSGADFVIDTPYGKVHFTYDFTIEIKDQERIE